MPVEVTCSSCNRRLRVPDKAAGKRIKCPQCEGIIHVPAVDQSPAKPGGEGAGTRETAFPGPLKTPLSAAAKTPASTGPRTPAAAKKGPDAEQWYLKTEHGETYGPVSRSQLDEWKAENRLTVDCQVLREGGDQWQWASDLYPDLEESAGQAAAPVAAPSGGDNPFGFLQPGGTATSTGGPAFSPGGKVASKAGTTGRKQKPKNYLIESILALLCCAGLFAIPAIIFASQVDSKWNAGDHSGALRASQSAKTFLMVAVGIGVLCTGLGVVVQIMLLTAQR